VSGPVAPGWLERDFPVADENKRNLHYFEAPSMASLFDVLQTWQNENEKRFLSLGIEKDRGRFCCIALTNPTEVIICNGYGGSQANVSNGNLDVKTRS
jgi:hypothetical protein